MIWDEFFSKEIKIMPLLMFELNEVMQCYFIESTLPRLRCMSHGCKSTISVSFSSFLFINLFLA